MTNEPAGDGRNAEVVPRVRVRERWRKITGYPGYEASDRCRVRSADRVLSDGRTAAGVILAPTEDKDGYERVKLGRKLVPVHICVLLAWHGRPEGRHLNGDQHDNTPGNLAWGSHRDNERDKRRGREGREGRKERDGIGVVSRPLPVVTSVTKRAGAA
jgi:hypothetical protein